MTPPVRFYPRARHDLLELTTYLTEQAGVDVADRLLQAVHFATAALARQPRMGKLFETTKAHLAGMRWFPASPPFINYLIFYRPAKQGIEVVRVLHGARDVEEMVDDPAG